MSTKTSTQQPPGRRTPLSLNASTKHPVNRPAIDNNKKEGNTNNQKTETNKKDNQADKKTSSEKKLVVVSNEARKPPSADVKKSDTAKNQNGVSTNGANGSTSKPKTDSSSGSSTPKKDISKKDTAPEVTAKNEGNKNKVDDKKKDKPSEEMTKKIDEKKESTESGEKKKIEVKPSEEKTVKPKTTENVKKAEKIESKLADVINLDSSGEKSLNESPVKDKKKEEVEMITSKTPQKEQKLEETPKKEEIQVKASLKLPSDDVEMMESLAFEPESSEEPLIASSTPAKSFKRMDVSSHRVEPSKSSPKSETKPSREQLKYTPDRKSCPRTFSSISGRRSIRPIGDYTFTGNLQIRESYRKINTELDFTTSSMNVTVGSEVPNNDSFSFFSRTRKRERSSPTRQSAMEVQGDLSPKSPKRARIDFGLAGFFNVMASPMTMLRARLSRATVQSTPKKEVEIPIDDDMVENVSGICVEEETTATEDLTVNPDSTVDFIAADDDNPKPEEEDDAACSQKPAVEADKHQDDIKNKEEITTCNPQAKKKCSIM